MYVDKEITLLIMGGLGIFFWWYYRSTRGEMLTALKELNESIKRLTAETAETNKSLAVLWAEHEMRKVKSVGCELIHEEQYGESHSGHTGKH